MSWENRDYYREPRGRFGGGGGGMGTSTGMFIPTPPKGSVTFWLLIVNISVFFLDALLGRIIGPVSIGHGVGLVKASPLEAWGFFSFDTAFRHLQLWRIITFQFLHAGFMHILGNMLGLFFFGYMAEAYFGSRRFLAFYLLCGASGSVAYVAMWGAHILISSPYAPLVGASAGIFAILVVAALTAPDAKVLLFFIIPIPLRVLVWGMLFIAAFVVITRGDTPGANAGGQAAHLGGAALGYLLYRHADWLNWADRLPLPGSGRGGAGSGGAIHASVLRQKINAYRQRRDQSQNQEVDRILDKVRDHGLQSLSRKEKKTLARETQKRKSDV